MCIDECFAFITGLLVDFLISLCISCLEFDAFILNGGLELKKRKSGGEEKTAKGKRAKNTAVKEETLHSKRQNL